MQEIVVWPILMVYMYIVRSYNLRGSCGLFTKAVSEPQYVILEIKGVNITDMYTTNPDKLQFLSKGSNHYTVRVNITTDDIPF